MLQGGAQGLDAAGGQRAHEEAVGRGVGDPGQTAVGLRLDPRQPFGQVLVVGAPGPAQEDLEDLGARVDEGEDAAGAGGAVGGAGRARPPSGIRGSRPGPRRAVPGGRPPSGIRGSRRCGDCPGRPGRGGAVVPPGRPRVHELGGALAHERVEQALLAAEVVVDGAGGDPRGRGDAAQARPLVPVLAELGQGRVQDARPGPVGVVVHGAPSLTVLVTVLSKRGGGVNGSGPSGGRGPSGAPREQPGPAGPGGGRRGPPPASPVG